MFGLGSPQELLILMAVIAILSMTGLWRPIMQGIRELRGEDVNREPPMTSGEEDLCYKIMGLSSTASWQEVERAYRSKAKVHHPDHGGDEDTMRALNDAYAKLKKLRRK